MCKRSYNQSLNVCSKREKKNIMITAEHEMRERVVDNADQRNTSEKFNDILKNNS